MPLTASHTVKPSLVIEGALGVEPGSCLQPLNRQFCRSRFAYHMLRPSPPRTAMCSLPLAITAAGAPTVEPVGKRLQPLHFEVASSNTL